MKKAAISQNDFQFHDANDRRRKRSLENTLNDHLKRITSRKLVVCESTKRLYHLCASTSVTTGRNIHSTVR